MERDNRESNEIKSELGAVKAQLLELQTLLHREGIAKKHLTEENTTLTKQLEEVILDNNKQTNMLEQERYSLQMKLSLQLKMAVSYEDDLENVKRTMIRQHESVLEKLDAENSEKLSRMNKQINELERYRVQSLTVEEQLRLDKESLNVAVKELRERLQEQMDAQTNLGTDMNEEQVVIISQLKADKTVLKQEVTELRSACEQHKHQIVCLLQQLRGKDEEIQEKERHAVSYYNTLERSREEMLELKVELDLARMEANKIKKKGNSLFSEVEDRRIVAEQELITAKIQCESFKRQIDLLKQNLHSVKMQMAGLLQTCRLQVDVRHMEQISMQLSQATSEVQELTNRLHEYELREKSLRSELISLSRPSSSSGDGEHVNHVQYFQALLQKKENEMVQLQKELKTKRLLLLAETDKLARSEGQLYAADQMCADLRTVNVRLRLKLEELQLKYEPDAVVTGTLRRVKIQQMPWDETSTEPRLSANDSLVASIASSSDPSSDKHDDQRLTSIQHTVAQKQDADLRRSAGTGSIKNKENVTDSAVSKSSSNKIEFADGAKTIPSVDDDVFIVPGSLPLSLRNVGSSSSMKSSASGPFLPPFPKSSLSGGSAKPVRKVRLSDDVQIIGNSPEGFDSTVMCESVCAQDQTFDVSPVTTEQGDVSIVQPKAVGEGKGRVRGREKGQRTIVIERSKEDGSDGVDGCKTQ